MKYIFHIKIAPGIYFCISKIIQLNGQLESKRQTFWVKNGIIDVGVVSNGFCSEVTRYQRHSLSNSKGIVSGNLTFI